MFVLSCPKAFANMFKIAVSFSLSLCLIGLFVGLYDHLLYSNYEIGWEPVKRRKSPGVCCSYPAPVKNDIKFLYALSRRDSNRIVCLVVAKGDGSVEMNPKRPLRFLKCNYGRIHANTVITKSVANALYGPPVAQNRNSSTYSLIVRSDHPATKNKKVLLDLKFEDDRLHAFRIRSNELESTDWTVEPAKSSQTSIL